MFISSIYTRSGRLYISLSHPTNERIGSKLGVALALKGYFVGYSYSKFLQPCYKVVARYANGTFGRVRHTKDVIFDMNVNFHSVNDTDLPSEQEFNNIPTLELVAEADNADALRRYLILPPALPVAPTPDILDPEPPPDTDIPLPDPFIPEAPDPHNEIGSTYDEAGNILYWYNIQHKDGDKAREPLPATVVMMPVFSETTRSL